MQAGQRGLPVRFILCVKEPVCFVFVCRAKTGLRVVDVIVAVVNVATAIEAVSVRHCHAYQHEHA